MGFGTIAANIIMFIAIVTIATGFVFYFNMQTQEISTSLESQNKRLRDELRTDITITSVSYDNSTNPPTTTAYVKNTGKTKLELNATDIYIDGLRKERGDRTISVEADTQVANSLIWDPGEIVKIEVNENLSNTVHQVRVVTSNGIFDEDIFSG